MESGIFYVSVSCILYIACISEDALAIKPCKHISLEVLSMHLTVSSEVFVRLGIVCAFHIVFVLLGTLTVNGGWTAFGNWSTCSRSCRGGLQTRRRSCTNPTPSRNGSPCVGQSKQTRPCNELINCAGKVNIFLILV